MNEGVFFCIVVLGVALFQVFSYIFRKIVKFCTPLSKLKIQDITSLDQIKKLIETYGLDKVYDDVDLTLLDFFCMKNDVKNVKYILNLIGTGEQPEDSEKIRKAIKIAMLYNSIDVFVELLKVPNVDLNTGFYEMGTVLHGCMQVNENTNLKIRRKMVSMILQRKDVWFYVRDAEYLSAFNRACLYKLNDIVSDIVKVISLSLPYERLNKKNSLYYACGLNEDVYKEIAHKVCIKYLHESDKWEILTHTMVNGSVAQLDILKRIFDIGFYNKYTYEKYLYLAVQPGIHPAKFEWILKAKETHTVDNLRQNPNSDMFVMICKSLDCHKLNILAGYYLFEQFTNKYTLAQAIEICNDEWYVPEYDRSLIRDQFIKLLTLLYNNNPLNVLTGL